MADLSFMATVIVALFAATQMAMPVMANDRSEELVCDNGSILRFNDETSEVQVLSRLGKPVAKLPLAAFASDDSIEEGIVATWSQTPGVLGCSPGNAPCLDFQRREFQYGVYWLLLAPGAEAIRCSSLLE